MTKSIVPPNTPTAQPTRRTALRLVGGTAVAAAAPLPALAGDAGPWAALESRFWRYYRLEDLPSGLDDDDPRFNHYCDRWQAAAAEIIATPACTIAGLRTKTRVLMLELTDGQSAYGEDLARSLMADLDRLAGSS